MAIIPSSLSYQVGGNDYSKLDMGLPWAQGSPGVEVAEKDLGIKAALDELNRQGSADAIASLFAVEAIVGNANPARCPVANWVKAKTGRQIAVGKTNWGVLVNGAVLHGTHKLPEHVSVFVVRFDEGKYQSLLTPSLTGCECAMCIGLVTPPSINYDMFFAGLPCQIAKPMIEMKVESEALSLHLNQLKAAIETMTTVVGPIPDPEMALCDEKELVLA